MCLKRFYNNFCEYDYSITIKTRCLSIVNTNVDMSLIGVGSHVDLEELKHIASSERNVLSVYDYSSLHKLRDVISRRTCVGKHHVSLHTH